METFGTISTGVPKGSSKIQLRRSFRYLYVVLLEYYENITRKKYKEIEI